MRFMGQENARPNERTIWKNSALAVLLPLCLGGLSVAWTDPSLAELRLPQARPASHMAPLARVPIQRPALEERLQRRVVALTTTEKPGTIIIDSDERKLYFILSQTEAIRYSIGVAREGFTWSGVVRIGRKAKWPTWTPPTAMIKREPDLAEYASGMPGGLDNPLGARAIYLYARGKDTLYRIHGTNEPWTIGKALSSGCFRLVNDDAIDLYNRVRLGARVIVK
jgi:lipoprotein-anchoring transpeptidase ErfK/SrfK